MNIYQPLLHEGSVVRLICLAINFEPLPWVSIGAARNWSCRPIEAFFEWYSHYWQRQCVEVCSGDPSFISCLDWLS